MSIMTVEITKWDNKWDNSETLTFLGLCRANTTGF